MKFRKKKKAEEETTTERIECFAFVVRETTRSEHSDVSLNERAHHVPTGFPFRYSFLLHSIGGVRPCEMNAVVVVYVDFFSSETSTKLGAQTRSKSTCTHNDGCV